MSQANNKLGKAVRNLYDWVLHWADTRYSTPALFMLAFAESSFFPIPPDVLLIALCISVSSRAFYYAWICLSGSALGGITGYLIGTFAWHMVSGFFFTYIPQFTPETFQKVSLLYEQYNFWIVFIAAFTPIPYKVITITAGVFNISFLPFLIASLIGRAARFYLVAGLIFYYRNFVGFLDWAGTRLMNKEPGTAKNFFGNDIRGFIDRYFEKFVIAFSLLLVGGFIVLKLILK